MSAAAGPLHHAIFLGWACAFGRDRVIYLSGPVTTGERFIDAVLRGVSMDLVLEQNLSALAQAAAQLRATLHAIVVDPSPLAFGDWSQEDYMVLWTGLIERHVSEVRFVPGWEYSLGCTREFVHAAALDIATSSLEGSPITLTEGKRRIDAAIADLGSRANGHDRLTKLRTALNEVSAKIEA